ncbi:hypothetical protein BY458DRAFT_525396 [Sporodiniella umbellata]|nr:hypothetical protein BY458DRAFT_525396 [Sporodiniella umbellata]
MRQETSGSNSSIIEQASEKQKTESIKNFARFTREKFQTSFFNTTLPILPVDKSTGPTLPNNNTSTDIDLDSLDWLLESFSHLNIHSKSENEYSLEKNEFTAKVSQLRTDLSLKNGKYQELYKLTEIPIEKERIEPLTSKEEALVNKVLRAGQSGQLAQFKTAEVSYQDIQKLSPGVWLNDELINYHFELLSSRASEDTSLPSLYCFNSFFCSTLREQGYAKIKRWTKRVDIFSKDLILVPINKAYHWVLGVIDMKKKKVSVYDSLNGPAEETLDLLLDYVKEEHLDKKHTSYDTSDWEMAAPSDIPHQKNAYDCGVFTCAFAERLSREAPLDFAQEDMDLMRRKMILNILNNHIQ